jgi:hypothetical protein
MCRLFSIHRNDGTSHEIETGPIMQAGRWGQFIAALAASHLVCAGFIPGPVSRTACAQAPGRSDPAAKRLEQESLIPRLGLPVETNDDEQSLHALPTGLALDVELEQLKRERDSLAAVRTSPVPISAVANETVPVEREALKQQLNALLAEFAKRPNPEPKSEPAAGKKNEKSLSPKHGGKAKRSKGYKSSAEGSKSKTASDRESRQGPVDSMALAQALFRTGDYAESLKAFELAQTTTTSPQGRVVIKYFTAACLGKLGSTQESSTLFREVANSKVDDVLAECAQWQLTAIQWRETTKARIAQLREAQAAPKPGPAVPNAAGGDGADFPTDELTPKAE